MACNTDPSLPMPVENIEDEDYVETEGDEYPDDASDIYIELDHAPTNSLGTYLDGIREGVEPLEEYQPGGYHPVHLGDLIGPDDRYRIIHKLGHGGFGTVWLSRDTKSSTYVAVKVMIADVSPDKVPELTLTKLDQSIPAARYIATPLDHFSITGPNGTHQCIALPVLGPPVSPNLWLQLEKDNDANPGRILRRLAHQTVQAMSFLHANQICHGDFRPSNILIKLNTSFDRLSEDELLSLIGRPVQSQVRTSSPDGGILPPGSPKYLVPRAELSDLGPEYLTHEICVIDFGESYDPVRDPPESLGIPENYLPPEVLLQDEEQPLKGINGPACDVWALGCTLFEIRQQVPLFYMIFDRDELLAEQVRLFGKMPDKWWDEWKGRNEWFDEGGRYLRDLELETEEKDGATVGVPSQKWSLEVALSVPCEVVQPERKVLRTDEDEQKAMADLLYKVFRYEPGERLSLDEMLGHEWFRM